MVMRRIGNVFIILTKEQRIEPISPEVKAEKIYPWIFQFCRSQRGIS